MLTLTFDKAITGLAASDITLTGVSVTKGTLSAATPAGTYTLPISGFTAGGTLSVAVAKSGVTISGSPRTATIYYVAGSTPDTPVTLSVTANGNATTTTTTLTLAFSQAISGLAAGDITLSGVAGVSKGTLSGGGTAYTLTISGFTAGGTLSVAVAKSGFTITPQTVAIFYAAGGTGPGTPTVTDVTVTPATISVAKGATQNFTATVTGTNSPAPTVTWSIDEAGKDAGTTISNTGTLTVSASESLATLTVKATSTADGTKSGTATVTVTGGGTGTPGTPNFDAAVGIKALTKGGSATYPTIDTDTGIIARDDMTAGSYGTWVSVAIPSDQPAVKANSTITVTYIATSDAPISLKKPNSFDDINPSLGVTLTGDDTLRTFDIPAVNYGTTMPTVISFQTSPPSAPWKLKITQIAVIAGADIAASLPVPDLKPASGGTPKTAVTTAQYTGTVAWAVTSDSSTTVSGNFAAATAYTATISLSAEEGYTFDGIAANAFLVTGALEDGVTHAAGTGKTLSITAKFPATLSPPAPFPLDFTGVTVKGRAGDAVVESANNGFSFTNKTDNYERAWAYFEVTFPAGYSLSDYDTIGYKITGYAGESDETGYKNFYINAFASEADIEEISTGSQLPTTTQIASTNNAIGSTLGSEASRSATITIGSVDGNKVWIAMRTAAKTGFIFKVVDITFSSTNYVVEP